MDQRLDRGGARPATRPRAAPSAGSRCRSRCPASSPASLLTFIPAVGDYVNASFLGSTNQAMIGNVIQSQYLVTKDYPIASALSFIMMALILVVVLIYIRFAGSESLMGEDPIPMRAINWLERTSISIFAGLVILYMLIPIAIIAIFSFNDPTGKFNFTWQGFTLDHWSNAFGIPDLTDALPTSIKLAVALDDHRHDPRHDDRDGPGPPPVQGPAHGEPADRDPDDHARGRDRRRAALDVRLLPDLDRLRDAADRARDVLDQLRRHRRPLAADRLRQPARGSGARPRSRRPDHVPDGDPAADRAGPRSAPRSSPSPSRSTTS